MRPDGSGIFRVCPSAGVHEHGEGGAAEHLLLLLRSPESQAAFRGLCGASLSVAGRP